MLKAKLVAAALGLFAMFSGHAITQTCEDPESPLCSKTTTTAPAAVGPIYVFGTFNTHMTVLVLDTSSSKLCSLSMTGCRPVYGIDAIKRAKMMSAAQLVKWDRSGIFGLNGYEMIACFQYYDSPSAAYFSCQTASASALDDASIARDITSLAWRTYYASGLTPLSADRVNAFYAKRKSITAYASTYGTLPPDRMKALDTQEDTVPPSNTPAPEAPQAEVDLELVTVIGSKPRNDITPPPGVTIAIPSVQLTPISTNPGRPPEILLNPCVTFQICSAPPPPPIAPSPPKICKQQCLDNANAADAACSTGTKAIGGGVAIAAPVTGIIVGVFADPLLGYAAFKTVGAIGGGTTAVWSLACFGMNTAFKNRCLDIAKTNGC